MAGPDDWPPPLTRARLIRRLTTRWLILALLIIVCALSVGPITHGSFQPKDWFWFGGLGLLMLFNVGLSVWITRSSLRQYRRERKNGETGSHAE